MTIALSGEELAVKERAEAFVDDVCRPLEASWTADDYDMDPDVVMGVVRAFREYGLRGVAVPKEVGGLGLGAVAKCLVHETLASTTVGQGSLISWSGLMEPSSALFRAPEWQREKYLYPIYREDSFFNLHISEPDAGSDAGGISTTAVRDGDSWVINGVKRWAPPPHFPAVAPSYLLCYAVTDPGKGSRGISSFLVDYPNPGVTVTNERRTFGKSFLGRVCDYEYRDCVVPAENLLGVEGQGFKYLMDQLNRNRTVIGARHVGAAQWAHDRAVKYAIGRTTFGRPIKDRQAIQWMLAESEIDVETMRLMVYQAASMIDRGMDARKQAAMVKCLTPTTSARVIDRAIQVHGGLGLLEDTRLTGLYADSRIAMVAEGSTEVMKMIIAGLVLDEAHEALTPTPRLPGGQP